MSSAVRTSQSSVTRDPEARQETGHLFYLGIVAFLTTISMTVVLVTQGVLRVQDWSEDPMSSCLGVGCAHAAVIHFTISAISPGLLISSYLSLFHGSLLAAKAYLLFLLLAVLVALTVSISFHEVYGLSLLLTYSLFAVIAYLSLKQRLDTEHEDELVVTYHAVHEAENPLSSSNDIKD